MGHDPFWPTYLATVQVLCVPAVTISRQSFAEVLENLEKLQEIKVAGIGLEDGIKNDLIGASKYKGGSILYRYTTSLNQLDIDRFPLEPNAAPQVVLGIYDGNHTSNSGSVASEQDSEQQRELEAAMRDIEALLGAAPNGRICRLLVINAKQDLSSANILIVPNQKENALLEVMQSLSRSLVFSISHLTVTLPEVEFVNPRASVSSVHIQNGPETSRSDVEGSQNTLEEVGNPSKAAVSQLTPGEYQKARYTIVIGLLNLYIGSWPDAMRRLNEGAILAREAGDSLWQARALEALLVCMSILAWKGEAFDVPEICLKAYSTSQMLSRLSNLPERASSGTSFANDLVSNLSPNLKWAKYAPIVARATVDLYSSLVSDMTTGMPLSVVTESRIRLGNLLLFAQAHGEQVDSTKFQSFILHQQLRSSTNLPGMRVSTDPSLVDVMLDSLAAPVDEASDSHVLSALAAVISSMLKLGSNRRHAFLFRRLLQKLVPILIRARKLGASEAGVHPAAAMSPTITKSQNDSQRLLGSFRCLLDAAAAAYDIYFPRKMADEADPTTSTDQILENVRAWQLNQLTGDMSLKIEILKLCITASDAFPDLQASLDYTSRAIRCGLRSLTISMTSSNPRPNIPPDEQARLVDGVKQSAYAARRLGLEKIGADYWDDFLVRDVQVYQLPDTARLTSHKPSELSLIKEAKGEGVRDPFIFNPFSKASSTNTNPVIVAGELVTLSVVLQNPLETEIDVNDIMLLTEGCDFLPSHHSMVLGPFWSQAFSLTGLPQRSGALKILGCRATIAGCLQKDFPIMWQDWQLLSTVKQKPSIRLTNTSMDMAQFSAEVRVPDSKILSVKVIEPQPRLVFKNLGLSQPSLMLLEGEAKYIELIIHNESRKMPTDFLLFTYEDNVTVGLQDALGKKDLMPVDMYEIQYQLKNRPTIMMTPEDTTRVESETLQEENATFKFSLWGRPGLVNAAIQMDFGHLGIARSEITQTFYTRQQRFPLTVTVNGSVEIPRCNIFPLKADFPWFKNKQSPDLSETGAKNMGDKYCMLSLDIRNVWPYTLSVELTSKLQTSADETPQDDHQVYTVHEDLQPGHVSRVVLLVPRLFIQEPYTPIPNLINQRQFVVSTSKLSLEAEATSRELFWYREELLRHISGTWKETKTERHGQIDFRKAIRLTPRLVEILKIDHVEISFTITPSANTVEAATNVNELGKSHFSIQTEAFVTIRVHVHNRSKHRLSLLLRLQPRLRDQPHNIALDLSRRLAWSGVLQQALHPPLEPDQSRDAYLNFVVFSEGNYEVSATVEEIKSRGKTSTPPRVDAIGATSERQIWHARSPCLIDAFDSPP